MKDMFDKKRYRLSDSEKTAIWQQISLDRGRRRLGRRAWFAPALGTAAVAVCGLVFLFVIYPTLPGGSKLRDKDLSSAHGRGQAPATHLSEKPIPTQVAKGSDQLEDKELLGERAGRAVGPVEAEPKKAEVPTAAAPDALAEVLAVTSTAESSQQTAAVNPPAAAAINATEMPDTDNQSSDGTSKPERSDHNATEVVGLPEEEFLRYGRSGEVDMRLKEKGAEQNGLEVPSLAPSRTPATPVATEQLGAIAVATEEASFCGERSPLAQAVTPPSARREAEAKRTSGVTPFVDAERESLSTFSLHSGGTSYLNVRGYLDARRMPPPYEVRVQEFINFFDQGYGPVLVGDFAIHADGAPSPFHPGYTLLRIGLRGRGLPVGEVASHPAAPDSQRILARDAAIQVKFIAERVTQYRLLGGESNEVAEEGRRDGAGEACVLATGHQTATLYEIKLAAATENQLGKESQRETGATPPASLLASVQLWYERPTDKPADQALMQLQQDVTTEVIAATFQEADPHLQLDAVVAEFAEILRMGSQAENNRLAALVPLAARLVALMPGDSAVEELRRLIEIAEDLLPEE